MCLDEMPEVMALIRGAVETLAKDAVAAAAAAQQRLEALEAEKRGLADQLRQSAHSVQCFVGDAVVLRMHQSEIFSATARESHGFRKLPRFFLKLISYLNNRLKRDII